VIRVSTPAEFLSDEFRKKDPDAFMLAELFHHQHGDSVFPLPIELRRDIPGGADWSDNRIWGAISRLFAHEILVSVAETVH
jgi:hypothetical protein